MSELREPRFEDFTSWLCVRDELRFRLDASRMGMISQDLDALAPAMEKAFDAMASLEKGAVANPDEGRQVGHYWLRAPKLAPDADRRAEIEGVLELIGDITDAIHSGGIKPPKADKFRNLLIIGIGGSALGPQFIDSALGRPGRDRMRVYFFDNTDPDGMDKVLGAIGRYGLTETLALVISKSGGTKETRNGMLEAERAFGEAGHRFAHHAIAITGIGSKLDRHAESESWIARVPMYDYIGGRTSVMSAVGLLPAALQGLDTQGLLSGAAAMDAATRDRDLRKNPAALLAACWYFATNGKGEKDMVVLPYKDRLELFSKYLQQLVMESLGKELDLDGNVVNQGIAVYGNKGSTDQHAYVQQLREGVNNFFVAFIQVLKDRTGEFFEVEDGATSGDYLNGFFMGTRSALAEKGRQSLTITVEEVSPRSVGMLIALFERAVGFYATLVNINAYHQPGVEAGKKAAEGFLALQKEAEAALRGNLGKAHSAAEIAAVIGAPDRAEAVFLLLEHLAANRSDIEQTGGMEPAAARFSVR
ncbi:MAG: glucose-6-phosphate isomerase [Sumerlaeia bacterium]